MRISNQLKTRIIELLQVSLEEDYGYWSHRLICRIQTEEITAQFNRSIWVLSEDIDRFIEGLQALDETRMGQAELQSISPKDFNLVIKAIDSLGHLAVNLRMEREAIYADIYSNKLEIEFEIDPTAISCIIQDLKRVTLNDNRL